jgi:hypothetical protein
MGQHSDYIQNNITNGEISQGALGRFDIAKYPNSVKTLENFLIKQLGGVLYRPGTRYVAQTKTQSERARLLKFLYSTTQNYVIEAGNLYFRFYTDGGRLLSGGNPVELTTVFAIANVDRIKYTQNADTMYLFSGVYPVQKLTRTSATTFTITEVAFKRGPFLDTNITSTTITASADTGAGITLTASAAIFTTGASGHTGSLWRIKNGVVKITATASTTSATATVQAEPDGVAGNLGTSGAAQADWAEGAWSAVRGYPNCGTFHDGRLYCANTNYQVGGIWGSVTFEYENFDAGTGEDDEAIKRELNADTVVAIRWLSSGPKSLQAGTTGGPFTINSGNQGISITPSNITASRDSEFGAADVQAKRMYNYAYYVQNNLKRILESGYFYDVDQNDVNDATLLADHILESYVDDTGKFYRGDEEDGGAYDMDVQQSPNNRLWVVRNDGQIAILTRNPRQEINGWCRILLGTIDTCDGKSGHGMSESIAILPLEDEHDQVWVIANRIINGTATRFVEYFTTEDFKYDWEPVRLDCSLTLNNPVTITDIIFVADNTLIVAPSHGFSNGDRVRFDKIVGTHQLNGNEYIVADASTNSFKITPAT